jgi:hypothetical protein
MHDVATPMTFIGLLVLLVGLLAPVYLWRKERKRAASARWPTCPGRVLETKVAHRRGEEGDYYEPLVTYEYAVGGRIYRGNRIGWTRGPYAPAAPAIERYLKRYRAGTPLDVYYNPAVPTEAVLDRGDTVFHRADILVCACGVVIGAALTAAGLYFGAWR